MENEKRHEAVAQIDQEGAEGSVDITPVNVDLSKQVISYNVTMAQIAKLEEEYKEVPADLTIKKNYTLVKKAATHLRGLRTDVEKRRKELKSDALAYGKKVDGAAKELKDRLLAIEEPFASAKKAHDTAIEIAKREAALAEEKRVDEIAERIANIKSLAQNMIASDSATIKLEIEKLEQDSLVEEWAMEFADKANSAKTEALLSLNELHTMKTQQENFAAQQAEAEAKRKLEEEEARKKREIEIAEEQERIAKERAAMEEERQKIEAERDRLAKEAEEQAAKVKAEQAEKDAAVEAEKAAMAAEIEALKKSQEVKKEVKEIVEEVKSEILPHCGPDHTGVTGPPTNTANTTTPTISDYKAAGRAMIKFIGNREVTKNLLDAIISNEVPNVKFTGEV